MVMVSEWVKTFVKIENDVYENVFKNLCIVLYCFAVSPAGGSSNGGAYQESA